MSMNGLNPLVAMLRASYRRRCGFFCTVTLLQDGHMLVRRVVNDLESRVYMTRVAQMK